MPQIEASDFEGLKINRTEHYNGNSLWGYIDGGADLYLEYGFTKLAAQEIIYQDRKYIIDIYRMNNAEAAFGIFSVSRFKCSGKAISKYSCLTDFQALFAKGSFYVSVVNEKGSPEEQKFTLEIAEKILSRIKEEDYQLPAPLNEEKHSGNVKLMCGILGVQNGFPDMEEYFTGLKDFRCFFAQHSEKGNDIITGLIRFASKADADEFTERENKRIKTLPGNVKVNIKEAGGTGLYYSEIISGKQ